MRTLILALALSAVALPAHAADCVFRNAFNTDSVSFTSDGLEMSHLVDGGAVATCKMEENTFSVGPFPYRCSNGETEWESTIGMFPSEDGEPGALLLYDDMIWYRRCA